MRHFLGWDRYALDVVCDFLLPACRSGVNDLSDLLLIVPTRQTGRRLREALALTCERTAGALLAPQVLTPPNLLSVNSVKIASDVMVDAVWVSFLQELKPGEYPVLFPVEPVKKDISWAFSMGRTLQRLRMELFESGLMIRDVANHEAVASEVDRWRELAAIETCFLEKLNNAGFTDPCVAGIEYARNPVLHAGITRIVVAAVADLSPLVTKVLDRLAKNITVDILVCAPKGREDWFDSWGRPLAERWEGAEVDISDTDLIATLDPAEQCREVIRIIGAESENYGQEDIAVGVPDQAVSELMEVRLGESGLNTFNPAGRHLKDHPLYQLLRTFAALLNEESFFTFRVLLELADTLYALDRDIDVSPRDAIMEADDFKNKFLPGSIKDAVIRLESEDGYPNLKKALARIERWQAKFKSSGLTDFLREWLTEFYAEREMPKQKDEKNVFREAAGKMMEVLDEMSTTFFDECMPDSETQLRFLLQHLQGCRCIAERDGEAVDLQGWVELQWENAPLLLVTGMNEGVVPESGGSDVFLPDTVRRVLGLRHDADVLARDLYFMQTMFTARRDEGRLCFICGRTSGSGDPLKPSRMLFHCTQDALIARAIRLFEPLSGGRDNFPPSTSFLLDPRLPSTESTLLNVEKLSVTAFADYLRCPFRFYLKRIRKMDALDEKKRELDALDFGNLIHYTLEKMGRSKEYSVCGDVGRLGDFLEKTVRMRAEKLYGKTCSLAVKIQIESAVCRLRAAAGAQVRLIEEGWRISGVEIPVKLCLNGISVGGRVDRIDRHSVDDRIRLIDYKTAESADKPVKTHLGTIREHTREYAICGKKAWVNLQLPLYALLASAGVEGGTIETAFFHLPKRVSETGVYHWRELSEELMSSARRCIDGVIDDIRAKRFWPPSERVEYDEFTRLFPLGVEESVDGEDFKAYLNGETA